MNSPRTLQVCKQNGIVPEELYYMDYREYLSIHPEITNLPDDIKHYRFNLLEKLRQKTIGMIKTKRKELIEEQENEKELSEGGGTGEKFTQKFNKSEADYKSGNKTFSEKMNKLITREKLNIKKIKEKQKQNIEFMIESQMKAELLNYKNMEKDRKLKEIILMIIIIIIIKLYIKKIINIIIIMKKKLKEMMKKK